MANEKFSDIVRRRCERVVGETDKGQPVIETHSIYERDPWQWKIDVILLLSAIVDGKKVLPSNTSFLDKILRR